MAGRWISIVLTAIAIFLLIFPVSAWPLQSWLRFGWGGRPVGGEAIPTNIEVQDLRSRLDALSSATTFLPAEKSDYAAAFIYSRYPFNFKNEILVSAGEKSGVKTGAVVAIPGNGNSTSLLGRVTSIWPDKALVQTVFDPRFQLAVRVGSSGADALLSGGSEPRLTLIAKNAAVKEGDTVYSAADDLPYGLPIGSIRSITLSSDELFREAVLDLPYDLNSLRVVWIRQ